MLLPELHETSLNSYVRTLLYAFAQEAGRQPVKETPDAEGRPVLIEPLSAQERRVLRLLVAGQSNPEIARELIISVNTVRTHVQSVYRKLGVHRRIEASEVARCLSLL
ncbi:hypothetical protein KSC_106050 [Ktedonobacter sp. SOSP1-52]|nr:hypothetical protein KSC_106050 [Ktedonobacter sp. SOSP1-52]